jgi:hypothetical protein
MRTKTGAEYQQTYVAGLKTKGYGKITIAMPKDYKRAIDIYAAKKGLKKQDVWINLIEIGMKTLKIPH